MAVIFMFGLGDLWGVIKWCILPVKIVASLLMKLFKTEYAFPVMFFIFGVFFGVPLMAVPESGLAKAGMILLGLVVLVGFTALGFFLRRLEIRKKEREEKGEQKTSLIANTLMIISISFGIMGLSFVLVYSAEQSASQKAIQFIIGLAFLAAGVLGVWGIPKLKKKGAFLAFESKYLATKQTGTTSTSILPIQSIEPRGVMFGRKDKHYIIKPEELDGHILVVGGVGSGKSSCIAIPTLRAWNENVFAIDIKGELYEKSKDNRPNIKVFNPLDESTYGYDPFFCLRTSHNPAQEARAIAQAILPLPYEVKDPFWIESAQSIFTAAILHFSAQGMSFLETIEQIQSTAPKDLVGELCESPEREVRYCVNSLADMEDRTLSSIMAEVSKNIVQFVTDRNLVSALSRTKNITPGDLEYGSDVYINIPEHLLRQWKTLLTLIVNQFLTHFEQRSEEHAQPILFLLDEFPRLGKISAMLDGLATLRSKKITICLIIQSLAQLDAIYGQNERKVISDTCAFKAILGATDADTQEYFSRLAGTYDKTMTSHGTSNAIFNPTGGSTSTNTQEIEKRIIPAHEFGMLNDIILMTPFKMPLKIEIPNNSTGMLSLFSPAPRTSEIFVPFARVDKLPYYAEE